MGALASAFRRVRLPVAVGVVALGSVLAAAVAARAAERIVSLAPSMTETLFTIGAGDQLVGVSDYCVLPAAAPPLPRTGSSLAPRYEAIARLQPTLILSESIAHGHQAELHRIAPTHLLPWLAVAEVVAGTRTLGALTGRVAEADALAGKFAALAVTPPPDAPRVLLVVSDGRASVEQVVFIRRNSLHGAALAAAGGRNAVDEDVLATPRLGLEQVLKLDPDVVLVLALGGDVDAAVRPWRRLTPLRAVREGRLAGLPTTALTNGPSVLDLRTRLAAALAALPARP
jgi:iron complex transport system substrate-binding protein